MRGILETALYARDLEAAERFYRNVVGLEVFSRESGRHVFFKCGRGMLLIFNPQATMKKTTVDGAAIPLHGASGPGHMAFAIREDEIDAWREHLAKVDVEIESEVDWPRGGHSIYFRDPAGNSIELATPSLWGV